MQTINTALCSSGLSGSSQGSYLGYYDVVYNSIVSNQPIAVNAEDEINVMKIIEAVMSKKS